MLLGEDLRSLGTSRLTSCSREDSAVRRGLGQKDIQRPVFVMETMIAGFEGAGQRTNPSELPISYLLRISGTPHTREKECTSILIRSLRCDIGSR